MVLHGIVIDWIAWYCTVFHGIICYFIVFPSCLQTISIFTIFESSSKVDRCFLSDRLAYIGAGKRTSRKEKFLCIFLSSRPTQTFSHEWKSNKTYVYQSFPLSARTNFIKNYIRGRRKAVSNYFGETKKKDKCFDSKYCSQKGCLDKTARLRFSQTRPKYHKTTNTECDLTLRMATNIGNIQTLLKSNIHSFLFPQYFGGWCCFRILQLAEGKFSAELG